ncbi:MAG: FkbM family methyltransferase [Bacteroidota bacterium]
MKKTIKKIYNALPLKKELFSIAKSVYSPSKSIYQHLHFKGIISAKVTEKESFKMQHYGYQLENSIFWEGLYGKWEGVSLQVWEKLSRQSTTIIDIGANTGVYALISKTARPAAQVFAIEPVKRVYEKLERNCELNNYDIITLEKAASDEDGEAVIYDVGSEHLYTVAVNKDLSSPVQKTTPVTIKTIRLDTIIQQYQLNNIDLIKIDVETHEEAVLEGMGKFLMLYQPSLLIEILNDEVARGVQKLINNLHYSIYYIDDIEGLKKVDVIKAEEHYNYLLLNTDKHSASLVSDLMYSPNHV